MASGHYFTSLFGSTLLRNEEGTVKECETSSIIKEGVVGLYFSAHWCPPCRSFTPILASWYNKLTSSVLNGKLEIVFLSSDQSEEEFDSYYSEMPWAALPYSDRDKKVSSVIPCISPVGQQFRLYQLFTSCPFFAFTLDLYLKHITIYSGPGVRGDPVPP